MIIITSDENDAEQWIEHWLQVHDEFTLLSQSGKNTRYGCYEVKLKYEVKLLRDTD